MTTTNAIGHQVSYNRDNQSVSISYNDAKGNKTIVTIFAGSDGNTTFDVGDKIVIKATNAKGESCTPQIDAGLIDNLLGYINGKTIDAVTELKSLQTSGNMIDPSIINNNGVSKEVKTFGDLSKVAAQDVSYPPFSDMSYYSPSAGDDLCSLVMGSIPRYYRPDSDVMPYQKSNERNSNNGTSVVPEQPNTSSAESKQTAQVSTGRTASRGNTTPETITVEDSQYAYDKLGLSSKERKYVEEFLSSTKVKDEHKRWMKGLISNAVNLETLDPNSTLSEKTKYDTQIKKIRASIQKLLYWGLPSIKDELDKKKEDGEDIADRLHEEIDDFYFDNDLFENALGEIDADNVLEVFRAYDKKTDGEENLWEGIENEWMTTATKKSYYDPIVKALTEKAKKLGIDVDKDEDYRAFIRAYEREFAKTSVTDGNTNEEDVRDLFNTFLKKVYKASYERPETAFFSGN